MDKELATFRLGGTAIEAARWIGISTDIYREWPDRLPPFMTYRVIAATIRRETARALGMNHKQFFADFRGETVIESMLSRVSLASVMISLMGRVPPEFVARSPEEMRRRREGKQCPEE